VRIFGVRPEIPGRTPETRRTLRRTHANSKEKHEHNNYQMHAVPWNVLGGRYTSTDGMRHLLWSTSTETLLTYYRRFTVASKLAS